MRNFKGIRFVLIYTMLLNLVATAAKLLVGYLTGSLSLIADGFDSLFDSLSNVIGLVAIYLARRPADEDHPYGHRRYEILMTMLISLLLFLTCFEILKNAYERLMHPVRPEVTVWSFAALLLSIAVHVYVTTYEKRRGEELRSEFLVADAMHTRADIFVSIGVMGGLIVVQFGYPILDTLLAVAIAILIARIGVDIIRSSTRILTDSAVLDVSRVTALVRQVPGVLSSHHIRSRGQEDDIHLDLHIRVAPNMALAQAHHIAHQVQRKLLESLPGARDVVVHVEPQPGSSEAPDARMNALAGVQKAAQAAGASVHHLNAHEIGGRYFVDLHLEVPEGLTLGEAHAQASRLEETIRAEAPEIAEINTHIEPALAPALDCGKLDDGRIAQLVEEATRGMPEVLDCHEVQAIRVEGRLLLTIHCILREQLPIAQAHDVTTAIEHRLRRSCAEIAEVTVHVEPDGSSTSA